MILSSFGEDLKMSLIRGTLLLVAFSFCFTGFTEGLDVTVEFPDLPLTVSTTCDLPRQLKLDIRTESEAITLSLTRSKAVGQNVDVYIIKKTPNGTLSVVKDTSLGQMEEVPYQDVSKQAEFEITCKAADNANTALTLDGTLKLSDGNLYSMQRSPDSTVYTLKEEKLIASVLDGDDGLLYDTIDIPTSEDDPNNFRIVRSVPRMKRAIPSDIFIDGIALIGKTVYDRFYGRSTEVTHDLKRNDALNNIRRYFAHLFNIVNMRYKAASPLLNVNLAALIIDEDFGGWIDTVRLEEADQSQIDALKLLQAQFSLSQQPDIPANDFLVSFTSLDMYTQTSGVTVVGFSYRDQICLEDGRKVLTVEYRDDFMFNVQTTAHEIGHNFGANHDGTENTCDSNDFNIMGSIISHVSNTNPFTFSSCSIQYFDDHINNLLSSESTFSSACLLQPLQPESLPDITGEAFGQFYSPDEQCQLIYGSESRHCNGIDISDTTICLIMYCLNPKNAGCYRHFASSGTYCGDGMWCEGGQCVLDPNQQTCTPCASSQTLDEASCTCIDSIYCQIVKLSNLCGTIYGSSCGC